MHAARRSLGAALALFALLSIGPQLSTGPQPSLRAQAGHTHHELQVVLEPEAHQVRVLDKVTLQGRPSAAEFLLNARLRITKSSIPVDEVPLGDVTPFFGINAAPESGTGLKRYRLRGAGEVVTLEYSGAMDFALSDQKEEYTRGFRQTAASLSPAGVYLSGASFWYPHLGTGLLTFAMQVTQPASWHVVSQGSGTSRDAGGAARWTSRDPMDEIYLVGGPLVVARDRAGAVETLVYLHEKEDALASKYLTTTAQYLEMYSRLIGPYPYDKFALVENFWETGYGMPSFTLLGREIIRFPFILHSSYPHEILHNWWGNSVFVDYGSGNWAEGLTAYLADHLVQEQRRRGAEHRRASLQKYRDYVKEGRDFALTDFRSRDSAATEAVGYGKTLMTFHMLRRRIGDEKFKAMLAQLYREARGTRASWKDLERVARAAAPDIGGFFAQWLERPGAPAFTVEIRGVERSDGGYAIAGTLRQTQKGTMYDVRVPLVVQTDRGPQTFPLVVTRPETAIAITTPGRPLMLHVDPYFDVFRTLDPRETPPSLSQIFGEPRVVAVLPASARPAALAAYRELLKGWQTATHAIDVRLDSEVRDLPASSSVWLVGGENRLATALFSTQAGMTIGGDGWRIDGQALPAAKHTGVAVTRHPSAADKVVGWIVVDPLDALPGLGRKLPHYGKYSYVGFEGTEPANMLSGEWRQADSPMRVDLRRFTGAGDAAVAALPPDPARPLAELPPVFSVTAMAETVARLTAPAMEGRGAGSNGLAQAANYIAEKFKSVGLTPGGDNGGYLQTFTLAAGPGGQPHQVANVIGYLPGTRPELKSQSVVVSAHYDHLGSGWPDVHKGDEGKVHPGADDNASGVAVLLELARAFAAAEKPARSIVFVAFAGEEARLAGSRHYVASPPTPFAVEGIIGVVNLDTVGRLFDQRLSVLGTGTAAEWQHIFRGAGFVTGVESRNIPEAIQSSDHVPFVERGIPAVQIFTGAHADYHRPTDTAEKIDTAGLVKVAAFVKEGIAYLAERPERLTVTISGAAPARPAADASARRASLGTVPDFAYPGPGTRAESIVQGSPAEKAGLVAGDILLAIDGQPIENLQAYSNVLRALTPGQTVTVTVRRAGKELKVPVTLAER